MTVKGKTLPLPLAIRQASLKLGPEKAELSSFDGTVGSSDLQAAGSLRNLLGFVLPNVYFHCTTAYNILRHNGVEIGKRDFLGG